MAPLVIFKNLNMFSTSNVKVKILATLPTLEVKKSSYIWNLVRGFWLNFFAFGVSKVMHEIILSQFDNYLFQNVGLRAHE
jgi:hypothetical protein